VEILFPQKIKSSENENGETHSITNIFTPKRGSKSPKKKNKPPCGPTSSNNLVCVWHVNLCKLKKKKKLVEQLER